MTVSRPGHVFIAEVGACGTVRQAEQGHEIKRPGYVRLVVSMNGDTIIRLKVGGVATKVVGAAVDQCRYAYVVTVMRGIVRKKPD